MFKWLIGLGMVITPFLTFQGSTRTPKLIAAVAIAFALSLLAIYQNGLRSLKNKWIFLFIGFMAVTSIFALPLSAKVGVIDLNNPIALQTALVAFVFAMMIASVYSTEFSKDDIIDLLNVAVWCGFIMSLYCFLQFFHIEQFFVLVEAGKFHEVGGSLGNPCVASAFIAMLVPIAISLKKYWKAAIMTLAVLATWRHVAIGALILSLIVMFSLKSMKSLFITAAIVVLMAGAGSYYFSTHYDKLKEITNTSGRIEAWKLAFNNLVKGGEIENGNLALTVTPHPITGFGLGAFSWANNLFNKNGYIEAHNEYLEVLYDMGAIGLLFMVLALLSVISRNFGMGIGDIRLGLLCSFICSCLMAGGFFIWHIGSTMFYGAFFAGLLHKEFLP
jgi:hypothetical protein